MPKQRGCAGRDHHRPLGTRMGGEPRPEHALWLFLFPTDRRPADGPPPPRGGDRPRRWAPEAVSAGSRGTPQTATRGTQPGAPGRARGGPASPARPPAEAGWRRLGAPAGVPLRQDPGAGRSGSCCG
ncbi:hypothetical protein NDU88_001369 [Pleurodeles waltl]|uniref:Uncharacterized protein n=1 Tax=Pleurodeles waltl TaxID=8319 RepID=A0AAV7TI45_PLEWA|nr:hypothetical protein NDU88_001369 [Pleurodeles waltl]